MRIDATVKGSSALLGLNDASGLFYDKPELRPKSLEAAFESDNFSGGSLPKSTTHGYNFSGSTQVLRVST